MDASHEKKAKQGYGKSVSTVHFFSVDRRLARRPGPRGPEFYGVPISRASSSVASAVLLALMREAFRFVLLRYHDNQRFVE